MCGDDSLQPGHGSAEPPPPILARPEVLLPLCALLLLLIGLPGWQQSREPERDEIASKRIIHHLSALPAPGRKYDGRNMYPAALAKAAAELGQTQDELLVRLERHARRLRLVNAPLAEQAEAALAQGDRDAFRALMGYQCDRLAPRPAVGTAQWQEEAQLLILHDIMEERYKAAYALSRLRCYFLSRKDHGRDYELLSQRNALGCTADGWAMHVENWQLLAALALNHLGRDDPRTAQAIAWRNHLEEQVDITDNYWRNPMERVQNQSYRKAQIIRKYGPKSPEVAELAKEVSPQAIGNPNELRQISNARNLLNRMKLARGERLHGEAWVVVRHCYDMMQWRMTNEVALVLEELLGFYGNTTPERNNAIGWAEMLLGELRWKEGRRKEAMELLERCRKRANEQPEMYKFIRDKMERRYAEWEHDLMLKP